MEFMIALVFVVILSACIAWLNLKKRFLGTIITGVLILIFLIQALFFDEFGWLLMVFIIFGSVIGLSMIIGTTFSEIIRYKKNK